MQNRLESFDNEKRVEDKGNYALAMETFYNPIGDQFKVRVAYDWYDSGEASIVLSKNGQVDQVMVGSPQDLFAIVNAMREGLAEVDPQINEWLHPEEFEPVKLPWWKRWLLG